MADPPNIPVSAYESYQHCIKGNYSLARNGFIEKWDKEEYRAHNKLGGRMEGVWREQGANTVSDIQRISTGWGGAEGEKI
jgi:hypothetical protein